MAGRHPGRVTSLAALSVPHPQAFRQEIQNLLWWDWVHAVVMPGMAGGLDQRDQVQPQPILANDSDNAEGGAAQRVGIAAAGRPLADGEEADQQVELVGQRDGDRHTCGRDSIGRTLRRIVVADGIGYEAIGHDGESAIPAGFGLAVISGLAEDVRVLSTSSGVSVRMSWPSTAAAS